MDPASTVLREVFGHAAFRPGQAEVVAAALAGRDTLAVLPTGGGKSLLYQVPAVVRHREGRGPTLVVSPLVALMDDQVAQLTARGVPAVALHRSQDADAARAARLGASGAALVYMSPERLASAAVRRQLAAWRVSAVAVDEAHCISQWGHDFRPDYLKLGELVAALGVPVTAVTATATQRVQAEIVAALGLRGPLVVVADPARPNLRLAVRHVQGDKARVAEAIARLEAAGFSKRGGPGRALVYVATRARVTAVTKALRARGLPAEAYHGGRTAGARATAQARFTDGSRPIMVATSAFGMGVDLPDVRLVLHLQAPGSLEAYVQEAGRAGRDGLPAEAVLLYAHADAVTQARLRGPKPTPGALAGWEALQAYAFGTTCREQAIRVWFRGAPGEPCGRCDACADGGVVLTEVEAARDVARARRAAKAARAEAEAAVVLDEAARDTIVAFVGALRRPAGRRLVAQALRGGKAAAVVRRGLVANPHHGALREVPEAVLLDALDALLAEGRIVRKGRKYPTVWPAGKAVRVVAEPGRVPRPRRDRRAGLGAALADFRRSEAKRRRWKPYQVFPDATLDAIVAARPATREALEALPGMGPVRVARFGERLLALVAAAAPVAAMPP